MDPVFNNENVCQNTMPSIPSFRYSKSANILPDALESTKRSRRRKFKPTGKIKKLRTSLVSKDNIIEALQQELASKSDEIESLKNELDVLRANMQQTNHTNHEHTKELTLKEELQVLEAKMSDFSMKYDENALSKMYENDPESLDVEQTVINTEMSAKWLQTQLDKIKNLCISVTRPHLHEYKEWNINSTVAWIKSLDNGHFTKYCDTLRIAFESDGITAADLPHIGQSDLATTPFDIRSFKDRKSLAEHFQFLKQFDIKNNSHKERVLNHAILCKEHNIYPYAYHVTA